MGKAGKQERWVGIPAHSILVNLDLVRCFDAEDAPFDGLQTINQTLGGGALVLVPCVGRDGEELSRRFVLACVFEAFVTAELDRVRIGGGQRGSKRHHFSCFFHTRRGELPLAYALRQVPMKTTH